jgi:hypothetical protein
LIQRCIVCHTVWEEKGDKLSCFCSKKCEKQYEEYLDDEAYEGDFMQD